MEYIRKTVLVALALTIVISIAFSSVFVYYPITAQLSPVSPPIILDKGSNAGKPDLSGSITVNLGENRTSATITIHPTYQASYYENITIIKNTDSKAYSVTLKVNTPMSLPSGSKAKLYIYQGGATRSLSGWPSSNLEPTGYMRVLDLTQTTASVTFTLNAGSFVEVDILVYIPEGSTLPSSATANIYLVYTPA